MRAPASGRTERQTAEARREEVLLAAVHEFAQFGLHGASVEQIARQIGISQPYIYRLYRTKKELFLAVLEACYQRIAGTFEAAAPRDDAHPLAAMGAAFSTLLADRDELLVLLHGFAACHDAEVCAAARQHYERIYHLVAALSGAGEEEMNRFMAQGMLKMVAAALDLPSLGPEHRWACSLLADPLPGR